MDPITSFKGWSKILFGSGAEVGIADSAPLLAANNLSDVTASTARTNLGLGTMALEASTSYLAIAGGTLTGKVAFSGTSHVGLCLNLLTTAQYAALTKTNGDSYIDTTLQRQMMRVNGADRQVIDSSGGQTISGSFTVSSATSISFALSAFVNSNTVTIASVSGGVARIASAGSNRICFDGTLSSPGSSNGWSVDSTGRLVPTTSYTIASPPVTPSQITADQNNYNLGTVGGRIYRLSSDASRTITGISISQASGQEFTLINVGSNAIVLGHQHASSTAANRMICTGGADITLAADEIALAWYDATTARFRVRKI